MKNRESVMGLLRACVVALIVIAGVSPARAQNDPSWSEPFPAFRIADNLYYVGTRALAAYLVTTPQGHILINSNLESGVAAMEASVASLGFKFTDIKVLLISHAHLDHAAGSALIKKKTGAAYMVMEGDVSVVESGGKDDFFFGTDPHWLYPAARVDRVLHDGDEVRLGNAVLVAHLTAGHTKGNTTWTMKVTDEGRTLNAVIVGSPNINDGYQLVGGRTYPQIADDFERGFKVLNGLPCDLFLGAHGGYFDLESKYARLKAGGAAPFVDAAGYQAWIAERYEAYRAELGKQKGGADALMGRRHDER